MTTADDGGAEDDAGDDEVDDDDDNSYSDEGDVRLHRGAGCLASAAHEWPSSAWPLRGPSPASEPRPC
eukprot:7707161-Pyramimonas_sp.AAC.1